MKTFEYEQLFSQVSKLLHEKKKIALITHEHPDGDALGSMIAMFSILQGFPDKDVRMIAKDPVPRHFEFLPYIDRVLPCEEGFLPELLIAFDYGDFRRLHISEDTVRYATTITFDHHPYHKQKGDILIIDPSLSSTCELVYRFFREAGYRILRDTACALLTGIFTDTGGFAHVNTSHQTLRIAGDLLRRGTSIYDVYAHTFLRKSPRAVRSCGEILRRIRKDVETGMAYVGISYFELERLGIELNDFDGIVNVIAMPEEVRFSLMLIEYKPKIWKGSLRSEPFKHTDVSRIARALGGGGHPYAAGFERAGESLQDVVQCVTEVAKAL